MRLDPRATALAVCLASFRLDTESALKPYNARLPSSPASIVAPSNASQCARRSGVNVTALAGGHSFSALSTYSGQLVVDLKHFSAITVDGTQATVGSAATLGDLYTALYKSKRAIGAGTCPAVGVGGHLSHGGFGFSSRSMGLALDSVASAEIALANGSIVTTSSGDLLWAIKGAASSFGIVTRYFLKTSPAPSQVTVWSATWNTNSFVDVYDAFQRWDPPSGVGANFQQAARSNSNASVVSLKGYSVGTPSDFNPIWRNFNASLTPSSTYTATQHGWIDALITQANQDNLDPGARRAGNSFHGNNSGTNRYTRSFVVSEAQPFSKATINALHNYLQQHVTGFSFTSGGANSAISRIGASSTSYALRGYSTICQLSAFLTPSSVQDGIAFVNGALDTLAQAHGQSLAAYRNYEERQDLSNHPEKYWPGSLPRLRQLKQIYDPDRVFGSYNGF